MELIALATLLFSSLVLAGPSLRQPRSLQNDTSPCLTSPSTASPTASSGACMANSSSAQTSLTVLCAVIAPNFAQNGLNVNTSEPGEVASLTSTNNFVNWCATLPGLPITNGQQLKNGSCNPAPMGAIPSISNMPSVKFVSPLNLAVVPPNTTFQITLAVRNIVTGYFVNPNTNYFAAPQELDPTTGRILGHVHVVIEPLRSLHQTTPTDPTKFTFFVALNSKADAHGRLYANVTGGLPKGVYKMSTMTAAKNHQAVSLPVAQHGVPDDAIYFTVAALDKSTNTTTARPHPSHPITSPAVHNTPSPTRTASAGNVTEMC